MTHEPSLNLPMISIPGGKLVNKSSIIKKAYNSNSQYIQIYGPNDLPPQKSDRKRRIKRKLSVGQDKRRYFDDKGWNLDLNDPYNTQMQLFSL